GTAARRDRDLDVRGPRDELEGVDVAGERLLRGPDLLQAIQEGRTLLAFEPVQLLLHLGELVADLGVTAVDVGHDRGQQPPGRLRVAASARAPLRQDAYVAG